MTRASQNHDKVKSAQKYLVFVAFSTIICRATLTVRGSSRSPHCKGYYDMILSITISQTTYFGFTSLQTDSNWCFIDTTWNVITDSFNCHCTNMYVGPVHGWCPQLTQTQVIRRYICKYLILNVWLYVGLLSHHCRVNIGISSLKHHKNVPEQLGAYNIALST